MSFTYDWPSKSLIDSETGDQLIFERILPESATYVCRLVGKVQDVPFRATLTWEGDSPPHAVWCVEHLGQNLLGCPTVTLAPEAWDIVRDTIARALLSYSASRGSEHEGARVRFQSQVKP